MRVPEKCNHYHLRMRVSNSDADMWLDDVRIQKLVRVDSTPEEIEAMTVSSFHVEIPFTIQNH